FLLRKTVRDLVLKNSYVHCYTFYKNDNFYRDIFYVDENGILCHSNGNTYIPKPKPTTKIPIDEETWYEFIDGEWYKVEKAHYEKWYISFLRSMGITREYNLSTKKQVGKKTLKKIRKMLVN